MKGNSMSENNYAFMTYQSSHRTKKSGAIGSRTRQKVVKCPYSPMNSPIPKANTLTQTSPISFGTQTFTPSSDQVPSQAPRDSDVGAALEKFQKAAESGAFQKTNDNINK